MKAFSLVIVLLSLLNLSSASRNSPRTASPNIPRTLSISSLTIVSPTSSVFASTATVPTKAAVFKDEDEGEAFLTAAKSSVTPAPEVIIGADGRILTLVDGGELQQKWHMTTFTSCHTFDATFTYCGIHEPILPGGDEIAAAMRPLDARGKVAKVVMVMLGTLVGVNVFLG